mgnify:CR=1 FL=1|tara:strand:- start:1135 stop:1680 length:546 start_codon:yes stop_codon:yes gene_type:complete
MNKQELTKWRHDYTVWDSPCLGEGLYLHVHFDEKDDIKRLGGRWKPAPEGEKGGHWWMPKDRLDKNCPLVDDEYWGPGGSGTIQDWLNNHKMIDGQYGMLDRSDCLDYANEDNSFVSHRLLGTDGEQMHICVFEEAGIVRLLGDAAAGSDAWMTTEEARQSWAFMMKDGYRKIVANEEESS